MKPIKKSSSISEKATASGESLDKESLLDELQVMHASGYLRPVGSAAQPTPTTGEDDQGGDDGDEDDAEDQ